MARLFGLICLLIAFVSLFPFNFQMNGVTAQAWQSFLAPRSFAMSRGDLLGNIVLFIPYGLIGVLLLAQRRSAWPAYTALALAGAGFGLFLQVLQIALPTRDESIPDVGANMIGLVVGALGAFGLVRAPIPKSMSTAPIAVTPALLLGCWIAYRLIPFVPSIDFKSIKNSLKPLLVNPQFDAVSVFNDSVSWLLAGFLLRHMSVAARYDRFLWALVLGTFLLEILIIKNNVHLSGTLGAVIGLALWTLWLGRQRRAAALLAALLIAKLILSGLAPFELGANARAFNLIPFAGLFNGSMAVNTLAVLQKLFLYGGLIYVLRAIPMPTTKSAAICTITLAFIEVSQVITIGHTPEITDPLLAVMLAYGLVQLQRYDGREQQALETRA
ncbi:MAG: VanZ family protein [Pseudomonadota bacterium]